MIQRFTRVVAIIVLLSAIAQGQDAGTIVLDVSQAMGAGSLESITYFGQAAQYSLGQSPNANGPWPRLNISDYHRSIDFTLPASRASGQTIGPAGGSNVSVVQRQYEELIMPSDDSWASQLNIWVTPWGFLKGALANNATAERQTIRGRTYDVISWSPPGLSPAGVPYQVVGYINDRAEIEWVNTWVEHNIFGDMLVETAFSHYREKDGLKYPTLIVQKRGGWPTFDAWIADATPNPPAISQLLDLPAPGTETSVAPVPGSEPPAVGSEQLAEGVYRITGGYVALAVEFSDHIAIIEAGQSEARGMSILEEARRLFPSKPVRYVVNTHHHFDHSGGLGPFVAEGITIVTHETNRALLERAFTAPRTLARDQLAVSGQRPNFDTVVGDVKVFEDDTRRLELHHVKDNYHVDGLLVAFLPREKILFQADLTLPPEGEEPNPYVRALVDTLDRLQLDFERYVPVHPPNPDPDRIFSRAEFDRAVGR
jgi:glyoxylase-like metal-dependent hydrolase (beta-lactamase superfamily II)